MSLLCSALFLTGCEKDITFSPNPGDEKRYWVYSAAQTPNQTKIEYRLNSLVRYNVETVGKTLTLHVSSEYLDLNKSNKHRSFNSAYNQSGSSAVIHSGFNLEVDKKSGTLLSLTGKNKEKWLSHVNTSGEDHPLLNTLRASLPGLFANISTGVGDKTTIPNQFGIPTTLTITQVTPDTVSATLEGQTDNNQLYGQLTLRRDGGWIDSLYAIIMNDGQSTNFIAIQSGDSPLHIVDPHLASTGPNSLGQAITNSQSTPIASNIMTKEALFSYDSGIMKAGEYPYISASIVHNLDLVEHSGSIALTDFTVQDKTGKDLGLSFVTPTNYHYFDYHKNSVNGVLLTGWNNRDTLKQTQSATATAHYYPDTITPYTIQWRKGETQPSLSVP